MSATGRRVAAVQARALAERELGNLQGGIAMLRSALDECCGDIKLVASVQATLAGLLVAEGRVTEALCLAEEAEPVLDGAELERLRVNRSAAFAYQGRLDRARRPADAEPGTLAGRLIGNGITHAYAGRFDAAESALAAAWVIGERYGLRQVQLMVLNNRGFLAARRGDLPLALALFGEVEPEVRGERLAQCRLDRAEALLAAGLAGEARELLEITLSAATKGGYPAEAANAVYQRGLAELACGDAGQAAESAWEAKLTFAGQDRHGWVMKADHALIRARAAAGDRSPALLRAARTTAARLDQVGWREPAARTRLAAARAFPSEARELLEQIPTRQAALRLSAYQATAHVRAALGDHRAALRSVHAAFRTAAEMSSDFASLELRTRAADTCADLLQLVARATPRALLTLEEQRRRILWRPPQERPRTPSDEPRGAEHLLRDAARCGGSSARASVFRTGDLMSALDGLALLELVRMGGELIALTARDGQSRRTDLGSYAQAVSEVTVLRYELTRRMVGFTSAEPPLDPLRARFSEAFQHLGDRELVIAPTGELQGIPWAALTDRPFTVVPSAAAWQSALSIRLGQGPVALLAGPGLANASTEISALADLYSPAVRTATGASALSGARLVHIAAHGTYREDDPLLSSLALEDGDLTAYEFDRLPDPPGVVVLSACDTGRGNGVLGLPGVFLSLGTRTVIASATKVNDGEAPSFMLALHRELASGVRPATALASLPRTPGTLGFQCYGAG